MEKIALYDGPYIDCRLGVGFVTRDDIKKFRGLKRKRKSNLKKKTTKRSRRG